VARGLGPRAATAETAGVTGLSVDGATLTALRRRDGWLELRGVRLQPHGAPVRIVLPHDATDRLEAREADLLGRAGGAIAVSGETVRLEPGGWGTPPPQLRRA